jgi:hypothetical protein
MRTKLDHAYHVSGWCNCEPYADGTCEYRRTADKVIDLFNPRDDEVAEVAIVLDAINAAADFIGAQPCTCTPEMVENWESCPRCEVLGQRAGKPAER